MRFLSYLTTLFIAAFLAACGGGGGSPGVGPGTQQFFTTAPSDLTLAMGAAETFTVGGGRAPYTAVSSNKAVAVGTVDGGALTMGGVQNGSTTITVRDAQGATKNIAVTVSPGKALSTTAPSNLTLAIGVPAQQTYLIRGGTAPYVVVVNNPLILSAKVSGGNLVLTGLTAGSSNVIVSDDAGGSVNIAVTVTPAQALFTTAAPSVTLANGSVASFSVGGGTAPYTATSNNDNVASVAVSGNELQVTAKANSGSVIVTVRDANNASVTAIVNVAPTASLFTTAPSAITVVVGSAPQYKIGGGVAPYTATSSNASVAESTVSGNNLTIRGVTVGPAGIVLRDSANTTVNIAVTVAPVSTLDLFTTAPSAVTLSPNTTTAYSIGGGVPNYTVTSSNTSVVRVTQSGTSFSLTAVAVGTADVLIRDNAGKIVTVSATVANSAMSLNPSQATSLVGMANHAYIIGGVPPYKAISGFPSAVSAEIGTLTGSTFTADVNGNVLRMIATQAVDPAQVIVTDSTGNSVNFSLKATPGTPLMTLGPSSLEISECFKTPPGTLSLSLYGASGTTNLFSSDTSLLTVPASVTGGGASAVTVPVTKALIGGAGISVKITAVDSTGATASSDIVIKAAADPTCP